MNALFSTMQRTHVTLFLAFMHVLIAVSSGNDDSVTESFHDLVRAVSSSQPLSSFISATENIRQLPAVACYDVDGNYLPNCSTKPTTTSTAKPTNKKSTKPTAKPTAKPTKQCLGNCDAAANEGKFHKVKLDPCNAENTAKYCGRKAVNKGNRICTESGKENCKCSSEFNTVDFNWVKRSDGCYVKCNVSIKGFCRDIDGNEDGDDDQAVCPVYTCSTRITTRMDNTFQCNNMEMMKEANKKCEDKRFNRKIKEMKDEVQAKANIKCDPLGKVGSCMCDGHFKGNYCHIVKDSDGFGGFNCQIELVANLVGKCSEKPVKPGPA